MTPKDIAATALRDAVARHDLGDFASWLSSLLTPAVALRLTATEHPSVGASRAGGSPDVPAGFQWPVVDSLWAGVGPETLHFVAQIDLAGLPWSAGLPESGMLYFFAGDQEDRFRVQCAVRYVPDDSVLERVERPAVADAAERSAGLLGLTPCGLHPAVVASLRPVPGNQHELAGMTDDDLDRFVKLVPDLVPPDDALLGGFASDVDYDPLEEVARHAKIPARDWRLLLRLPSHRVLGTCFWDWYALGFFIPAEDLETARFDRVHAMLLRD